MKYLISEKPCILFLHNKYLQLGGEDSVVSNEINLLKKEGYTVFYKVYDNQAFNTGNVFRRIQAAFSFFFNVPAFFSIYFFVKKHKVQIVHVHNFFYVASPSVFWAGKLAGAKTIMTMHNYRLFCLNALFFRNGVTCMDCVEKKNFKPGIIQACFKSSSFFSRMLAISTSLHRKMGTWTNKVDRFIVLNPFMKELLLGISVNQSKIFVKPNFIGDSLYNNYHTREDFYLYAGRLQEEKGIRHVVEAFNISGRRLIIAGEGDMVPFIKENAKENIEYIGQQSQKQLAVLFLQCRGFVFASFLTEGMPMTIIEAHAAGAIPIVGNSVSTQRMIIDGEDGFIYTCGDSESLNRQLTRLEELEIDVLNNMSLKARKKFETYYQEKGHLAAIEKIYAQSD
jgi:glycosyltransferase involved in cell wall biosynthesis